MRFTLRRPTNNQMTTIRPATLDDNARLFELLIQLVFSRTPSREAFDLNLPVILLDPNSNLCVAEAGGEVVGYGLSVLQMTLHANGPVVVVQELVVDLAHRCSGVGAALMTRIIEDAKHRGATEITLATSRAKDYYPRFGFNEVAGYFRMKI